MRESTRAHRRTRQVRRLVVGGIAVAVVLAAGTTAWAMSSGSGTSYRTATVGRGSVQQVLSTTGTLSPLHSAAVDFQVAGTVGRVLVHQGATVRSGQRLATLDRTSLTAALAAARSALSSAESQLATDESGESSTTATTTSTASGAADASAATAPAPVDTMAVVDVSAASPAPSPRPTSTGTGGAPVGSGSATVARDQAAVVAAQHTTDTDLSTATVALKSATSACGSDLGSGGCTTAAATLLADQRTVATDEKAVLTAESTLDADVEKLLASARGAAPSPTPRPSSSSATPRHGSSGSTGSTGSGGTTRSGSATSRSAGTRTVTAASLAADEASIDTDRATVATDRASVAEATLTSPISGHVAAVTISAGDTVSGSSSSTGPAVEIRTAGRNEVTLSLSATQVRTITAGMAATATPDGAAASLPGTVISIGAATSDSTYPVVVELRGTSSTIVTGADAAVSVTLATAHNVITVPTSAVHRSGSTTYVEVLNGTREVRHTVVTGATGAALTQITAGVTAGQRVVLADLGAAVPSSSNTLTQRTGRAGVGGRFGGAGGAGGFGGAAGG